MNTPRVSILLPVWNAASTLATCLESIRRQSEPDWECVIVDDGSTDGSTAIARAAAEGDPRFRLEARDHSGLVASLEAGRALCRAPLIARMDADDWMHRDRLALQCAALDAAPELEAVGSLVRSFPRRTLTDGRRRYEAWLHSLDDPRAIWNGRFVECPVAHPTLMIRRASLDRLGYRDRGWPEDHDLLLRLLARGPRIGIVSRRLVGWRDHPDRLSRRDPRYTLDAFMACRAWHLSRDFLASTRSYVLWGHGPTGRSLRRALTEHERHASAIVEVHPRRLGQRIHGAPVIAPDALRAESPDPIVVSVAGPGPRGEIRASLESMGFEEGHGFVFAA